MSVGDESSVEWEVLGRTIRERRRAHQLTLVDLARKVELSQPFLSQVENGRARPSMQSLYRIAHALDTTPQALFGGSGDVMAAVTVTRGREADTLTSVGDRRSLSKLLLTGPSPFHVLELDGLPASFGDYWEHAGFEAVYVITGPVEAEVGGELHQLAAGDLISYPATTPHRLRSGRRDARVLIIETTATHSG